MCCDLFTYDSFLCAIPHSFMAHPYVSCLIHTYRNDFWELLADIALKRRHSASKCDVPWLIHIRLMYTCHDSFRYDSSIDAVTHTYTTDLYVPWLMPAMSGRNSQKSSLKISYIANWVTNWLLRIAFRNRDSASYSVMSGRNSQNSALWLSCIPNWVTSWLLRIILLDTAFKNRRSASKVF